MPAVFEPGLMAARMPFGEVMRMTLMGTHERISAARAYQVGLVSQVVAGADLLAVARDVAATIASQPPLAVQASVRTLWASRELPTNQLVDLGNMFLNLSMSPEALRQGQDTFRAKRSGPPTIR
jgi:enoyl-CoA hydratase/carnithine racemase